MSIRIYMELLFHFNDKKWFVERIRVTITGIHTFSIVYNKYKGKLQTHIITVPFQIDEVYQKANLFYPATAARVERYEIIAPHILR